MQTISLKKLIKLAGGSNINEDEKEFSYEEMAKIHSDFYAKTGSIELAYIEIIKYLSNIPQIEFVGEGSSRTVLAMHGGKCVKLAKNIKGVSQNKVEAKSVLGMNMPCFAQVYAKSKDAMSLLTECCTPMTDPGAEDCMKRMDIFPKKAHIENFNQLRGLIWHLSQNQYDIKMAKTAAETTVKKYGSSHGFGEKQYAEDHKIYARLCQMMLDGSEVTPKILKTLFDFCKANPSALHVGDVMSIANWGFAIREHHITPVLIDAGLSEEVFKKHYMG